MTLRRSLYARPEIIGGEQCAEAPLGRRRSDRAAAWRCSRQSRALAGGLTAEPSWLPSAARAAHSNTVRRPSGVVVPGCPDAHRALVARSASSVSVPVSSVHRPVCVRRPCVQCPASSTCPVSACPVSGVRYVSSVRRPCPRVRCPVSGCGVRCERPASVRLASVSALSAPVTSSSAWMRRAATRLGTGRVGQLLDPWKPVSRLISQPKTFTICAEKHKPLCRIVSTTSYESLETPLPAVTPFSRFLFEPPSTKRLPFLPHLMSPLQATLATLTLVLSSQ
jgi:hypothetical protein